MKNPIRLLLLAAASLLSLQAYASDSSVAGLKEACVAGSLLDANRIPYKVVIFRSSTSQEAGCIYDVNGVSYLYTVRGSAKINPAQVAKVPLERVSRDEVYQISDGSRELRNGCLVFATCAYSQYKQNPHIKWAGIIAAQVIAVNNYGGDSGASIANLCGHAITAFENDRREIFIQEDGEEARKVDNMTELAQRGDTSWHDSSTLIYCDHHIQGITTFKDQFGRPM
jgi:hypothetical protein